ncbi:hypothetical protein VIM7927_03899 [Vibrio mangrovi]|uniref:Uncharacterized protein n=1 Tax=Vibrio mangrovi TaxID=474394 RepID=A0A1Y6IY63_9VIBR|nr:hypothetical protein VIM7927_03899 [Vibrio mangrovi]
MQGKTRECPDYFKLDVPGFFVPEMQEIILD